MNEKKSKRYPTDRVKLHALLEKKEQELIELQADVEALRVKAKEADRTEIHATVEMYNISVEQLKAFLLEKFGSLPVSEPPTGATVAEQMPEYALKHENEEESMDDEDA